LLEQIILLYLKANLDPNPVYLKVEYHEKQLYDLQIEQNPLFAATAHLVFWMPKYASSTSFCSVFTKNVFVYAYADSLQCERRFYHDW